MAVGKNRSEREERERARLYQARQSLFDAQTRRRTRDNVIAGVAGGALILAVTGGQIAYFTMGPGVPEPTPSPSASTATTPAPDDSANPAPTDSASPAPSESVAPSATPTPTP